MISQRLHIDHGVTFLYELIRLHIVAERVFLQESIGKICLEFVLYPSLFHLQYDMNNSLAELITPSICFESWSLKDSAPQKTVLIKGRGL